MNDHPSKIKASVTGDPVDRSILRGEAGKARIHTRHMHMWVLAATTYGRIVSRNDVGFHISKPSHDVLANLYAV